MEPEEKTTEPQLLKAPLLNGERLGQDIGNTAVLAPHPDDEALGCGGLITLLQQAKKQVHVIFMTSGSASHPNSKTHPPEIVAALREDEALRSCKVLGLEENCVHFLRAPDSGLNSIDFTGLSTLVGQISEILRQSEFKTLVLPWRRDPHPDHRVTYELGKLARKTDISLQVTLEYPIWLWKNGQEADWPSGGEVNAFRLDISSVRNRKWKAIQSHRSQLGAIIKDDPYGFELTETMLEPFRSDHEHFFIASSEASTRLTGGYFDNLYSEAADPWNFRNSRYEREKYAASMESIGPGPFENGLELGCSIGVQTRSLAKVCQSLTAVDISEKAIAEAKATCSDTANVGFKVMDVAEHFPEGRYDLITCCEMGYYLDAENLENLFVEIDNGLEPKGRFLMVHWTGFVPDYPLTGDEVHERFEAYADQCGHFREVVHRRTENYRLQVWEKSESDASR